MTVPRQSRRLTRLWLRGILETAIRKPFFVSVGYLTPTGINTKCCAAKHREKTV